MECESCGQHFTIVRKKRMCLKCGRSFCGDCIFVQPGLWECSSFLLRQGETNSVCDTCLVLSAEPLCSYQLRQLRTADLQSYLRTQRISADGCIEKDDLIRLLVQHSSSSGTNGSRLPGPSVACNTNPSPSVDTQIPEDSSNEEASRDATGDSHRSSPEQDNVQLEPSNSTTLAHIETGDQEDGTWNTSVYEASCTVNGLASLDDIKTVEDIDKLTVKQMKELLLTNHVDFRGCCEKKELMEHIKRLWLDKFNSEKEIEKINPSDVCKVCMDARIECVLLECGHMATCMVCGRQLNECPVCHQFVVRAIRTFRV